MDEFAEEMAVHMRAVKAEMANFSPAMLIHIARWCEFQARNKVLAPTDG